MTRLVPVSCALALGLSLVGCKDTQACEQTRLEMAKTWKKVQENAATRASKPDENLPEDQKEALRKVWGEIESKAHEVHGCFKTSHISWDTADQGSRELVAAYDTTVPNKEDPMVIGFGRLLQEANVQYTAFKADCK